MPPARLCQLRPDPLGVSPVSDRSALQLSPAEPVRCLSPYTPQSAEALLALYATSRRATPRLVRSVTTTGIELSGQLHLSATYRKRAHPPPLSSLTDGLATT